MTEPTKILLVDDDRNFRVTLADILRDQGYRVHTAVTGTEALALSSQEEFDVVLMDVRLPDLKGIEVFRKIRKNREGLRVILMSALSLDELKFTALEEGAIAFLTKPLDLDGVLKLINEARDTTVLLVANDDEAVMPVCTKLKEVGYRVTVARSPHEALRLVEQIHFDIVFIDAHLPVMNGLELYLHIKRITPTTVAIMIAGREEEFERLAREAVQQTAYTMLRKPLDIDSLLALLQRIARQRVSGVVNKPGNGV
jgi:DNA-binding NtrC family response regulator